MSDSKTIDDGGPAFPVVDWTGAPIGGMSLRDWFAGQVLIGYVSDHRLHEHFAHHAYKVADAMLAARKEQPSGETTKAN